MFIATAINDAIVLDFSAGSQKAFTKIFEHYKGRLYSLSMKYTKSGSDSEDIVLKVFMKLWENKEKITTSNYLQNWLFKVIVRTSLNFIRDNVSTLELKEVQNDIEWETSKNELEIIETEMIEQLCKAILTLPPMQKKIFKMNCIQNISAIKISTLLNLKVQTVYNHINRARKNVQKEIEKNLSRSLSR